MKTERVAIAYRLLFAYPFVRPESEQNSSHLQIDCAGSLAIVTLCSVTASFMTCYLRKTTEAPAISTRPGLPTYRAWKSGDEASAGHSLAVARTRYIKGRQALRNIRLPMNEALLAQEQVDLQRVQLGQEATKSCNERPSRSTDQAMTMSNSRRAASRHGLSNGGRLSRPLAPLMP
jgi:hypothetical protein